MVSTSLMVDTIPVPPHPILLCALNYALTLHQLPIGCAIWCRYWCPAPRQSDYRKGSLGAEFGMRCDLAHIQGEYNLGMCANRPSRVSTLAGGIGRWYGATYARMLYWLLYAVGEIAIITQSSIL